MQMQPLDRPDATVSARPPTTAFLDPLDPDAPGDDVVVTSKRSLVRLALVAAETATRFAREGVSTDPVAWMMAPRLLFEGRAAMDACLELDDCLRAVLLHGLSLGMDADPEFVDGLIDDEDRDLPDVDDRQVGPEGECDRRLWTSYLVERTGAGYVQAFDALIAGDRCEAEARLRARHGSASADGLEVVEGFDPRLPLAEALVSPALADVLEQVAADPASPLAEGLSISIQQRFSA